MNRRSLLKLLPLAALGIAVKSEPATATAVIESPRGTRKTLRHREFYSSPRATDARIITDDYLNYELRHPSIYNGYDAQMWIGDEEDGLLLRYMTEHREQVRRILR